MLPLRPNYSKFTCISTMKLNTFEHHPSKNCETGVMSNLLRNKGFSISGDLLFGIGAGIYFIYFPWLKVANAPMCAFRYSPGAILKLASKFLNVKFQIKTFPNVGTAMDALDQKVVEGIPVGITGDLYYFEVFPAFMEMHFNGHNLVVFGKDETDDTFWVSDPVIEDPVKLKRTAIERARFTEGLDNPKGRMYWVEHYETTNPDLSLPIKKGVETTCKRMLSKYFPFGGVNGIRFFAKQLLKYPKKYTKAQAVQYITHFIRLQEIIGSDGSAYRIQYALFLKEAGALLAKEDFVALGQELKDGIVVDWRNIAVEMARFCRANEDDSSARYQLISQMLLNVADKEELFFRKLQIANR